MTNENTISTLNNLIETCKDGQEGFKDAAEGVENSNLKRVFYEYSQQRSQFSGELQQLVRELGSEPEDSSSFTGSIHRGWLNIKSVITGNDETSILNECERGEDVAVNEYKKALAEALPQNISEVVQRQYAEVQAAHDQIKGLRNSFKTANA